MSDLTVAVALLAAVVMVCGMAIVHVLEGIRNALRSRDTKEET